MGTICAAAGRVSARAGRDARRSPSETVGRSVYRTSKRSWPGAPATRRSSSWSLISGERRAASPRPASGACGGVDEGRGDARSAAWPPALISWLCRCAARWSASPPPWAPARRGPPPAPPSGARPRAVGGGKAARCVRETQYAAASRRDRRRRGVRAARWHARRAARGVRCAAARRRCKRLDNWRVCEAREGARLGFVLGAQLHARERPLQHPGATRRSRRTGNECVTWRHFARPPRARVTSPSPFFPALLDASCLPT